VWTIPFHLRVNHFLCNQIGFLSSYFHVIIGFSSPFSNYIERSLYDITLIRNVCKLKLHSLEDACIGVITFKFWVNMIHRTMGQVSSEYFGFPCHAFHQLLHTHHHPSSSEAGTIGHLVASVIVDSVPLHPKKKKRNSVVVEFERSILVSKPNC
jgi:hypothetical protein